MSSSQVAPTKAELGAPGTAFDLWLERGLHKLYDDVAKEPIPPELLELIESDRRKDEDDNTGETKK